MPNLFNTSLSSRHFQSSFPSSRLCLPYSSCQSVCMITCSCNFKKRVLSCGQHLPANAFPGLLSVESFHKSMSVEISKKIYLSCNKIFSEPLHLCTFRSLRSVDGPFDLAFSHGMYRFRSIGIYKRLCRMSVLAASIENQEKLQDFAVEAGKVQFKPSREQSDLSCSAMQELKPVVKVKVIGLGTRAAAIINFCMQSRLLPFAEFWLKNTGLRSSRSSQLQRCTGGTWDANYEGKISMAVSGTTPFGSQQALSCKDMTFLVMGAGGTNCLEVAFELLKAAHSKGGLVVAIVTQPFAFEGQKRVLQVQEIINSLQKCADLLFVIQSNALLLKGNVTLEDASKVANKANLFAIKAISDVLSGKHTIYSDGSMSGTKLCSIEDIVTILRSSSMAQIGCGSALTAEAAIKQATLNSPFLNGLVVGIEALVICTLSCSEVTSETDQQLALGFLRRFLGSKSKIFCTWIEDATLLKGCIMATIIVLRLEGYGGSQENVLSAKSSSQVVLNRTLHQKLATTVGGVMASFKEATGIHEITSGYQVPKDNITCSGIVQDESSHTCYGLLDKNSIFDREQRDCVSVSSRVFSSENSYSRKPDLGDPCKIEEVAVSYLVGEKKNKKPQSSKAEMDNSLDDPAHQSDAMIREYDIASGAPSEQKHSAVPVNNDNKLDVDDPFNHNIVSKHGASRKRKSISESTSVWKWVLRDDNIDEKRLVSEYHQFRGALTNATESSILNEQKKLRTVGSEKGIAFQGSRNTLSQKAGGNQNITFSFSWMQDLGFTSWNDGPYSTSAKAWAKARRTNKEEDSVLGRQSDASTHFGVRPSKELSTCSSVEVSEQAPQSLAVDPAAIPLSRAVDIGLGAVADIYRAASALFLGSKVDDSQNYVSVSKRAASMLEQERGQEFLTPVSEMSYKNGFYKGHCESGVPNGKGCITFADGSFYDGQWKKGKRLGPGSFYYANGDMYQGSWKDDQMHGQGWLYFYSGDRFHATFERGKANGGGRLYSAEGDVFFGQFRDNWRHGDSLYIESTGVRWHEVWDYGTLLSRNLLEDFENFQLCDLNKSLYEVFKTSVPSTEDCKA